VSSVLLLQLALPLAMIVWLWRWPSHSMPVLLLMLAAQLSVLTALMLAGVWTLMPWWIMALAFALWFVLAVRALASWPQWTRPRNLASWLYVVAAVGVLALGGGATTLACLGQYAPSGPSIDLALPVKGGDLLVANGGSRLLLNAHQDTLDLSIPRHRLWHGQSYGVDLVALNAFGITSDSFQAANPARYKIFGRPIHAPCSGAVSGTRTGRPDLPMPQVDEQFMEGNYVSIRCGAYDVVMAHLKNGSITARPGDMVRVGDIIGQVGNSGMSDEPHLHIHAQTPGTKDAPFSGQPVVMRLGGEFLSRNDRI
jgi:Peptidase family M23